MWKSGQPALTRAYKQAKDAIYLLAKSQVRRKPYNSRVEILFEIYTPDRRRRDILNYTQLVCDGIEGVAYENDALIDKAVVIRMDADKENPRIEVTVTPYTGNDNG